MPAPSLTSIDPPERLLMDPGPPNPDRRVLAAMAKPMVGHLGQQDGRTVIGDLASAPDLFRQALTPDT